MSKSGRQYRIEFDSGRVERGWSQLKKQFPDRMKECIEFLEIEPANRLKAVGKLKKLQGSYKGILQYDITKDEYRIWYVVDKKEKVVRILYAGAHPE